MKNSQATWSQFYKIEEAQNYMFNLEDLRGNIIKKSENDRWWLSCKQLGIYQAIAEAAQEPETAKIQAEFILRITISQIK